MALLNKSNKQDRGVEASNAPAISKYGYNRENEPSKKLFKNN